MKPELLLHICCAPDEAWVVHTLRESHDLRCFFCNPNIQPKDEYEKRLAEAEKTAALYNVPFDADPYNPDSWEQTVVGVADSPEGGDRCDRCFLLRLKRTALFCQSIQWTHFTTVMSVSPYKNILMLNKTGKLAADEFGLIYEPYNFKKQNGFLNSLKLCRELGLYRQDYCGCRLSKIESEKRKQIKKMKQAG